MKFLYYIAGRFFPLEEKEYMTQYSPFFNEIVTADRYLCKLRYFDTISNEYVGIIEDYGKIKTFAFHQKEQLIKFTEVNEEMVFDSDEEFEYCGFDIMNTFEDESILTGMGIPYDNKIYKYTQYGLLDSFEGSKRWVADHSRVNSDLENGDYLIFAVWRKSN